MKKRRWTNDQKLKIALEGLKGEVSVAELCNGHEISQTQYYQWRDRLLKDGAKVFDHGGADKEAERLGKQVSHLKTVIGDLTVELKKEEELGW